MKKNRIDADDEQLTEFEKVREKVSRRASVESQPENKLNSR